MRKSLFTIFAVAALLFSAATAHAKKTVEIAWPFSAAAVHGVIVRDLINQANSIQDKYEFVFFSAPGAGGSIALNRSLQGDHLRMVAHSSSFWTRTLMNPEGRYNTDDFTPLAYYCAGDALAIGSAKYKTLSELMAQPKVSIGVNPGSITTVVGMAGMSQYKGDIAFPPYPDTIKSVGDAMGGHIDAAVEFYAALAENNKMNILAVTGSKSKGDVKTFGQLGVKGLENVFSSYAIVVPKKSVTASEIAEFRDILGRAAAGKDVLDRCENMLKGDGFRKQPANLEQDWAKTGETWKAAITRFNLAK